MLSVDSSCIAIANIFVIIIEWPAIDNWTLLFMLIINTDVQNIKSISISHKKTEGLFLKRLGTSKIPKGPSQSQMQNYGGSAWVSGPDLKLIFGVAQTQNGSNTSWKWVSV